MASPNLLIGAIAKAESGRRRSRQSRHDNKCAHIIRGLIISSKWGAGGEATEDVCVAPGRESQRAAAGGQVAWRALLPGRKAWLGGSRQRPLLLPHAESKVQQALSCLVGLPAPPLGSYPGSGQRGPGQLAGRQGTCQPGWRQERASCFSAALLELPWLAVALLLHCKEQGGGWSELSEKAKHAASKAVIEGAFRRQQP